MKTKIFITAAFIFAIVICLSFLNLNAGSKSDSEIISNPIPVSVFVYNGPNYVPGATVTLRQADSIPYTTTTGEYGKAVFTSVAPGYYNIWAVKSGLGSGHINNQYISGSETFYVYITDFE